MNDTRCNSLCNTSLYNFIMMNRNFLATFLELLSFVVPFIEPNRAKREEDLSASFHFFCVLRRGERREKLTRYTKMSFFLGRNDSFIYIAINYTVFEQRFNQKEQLFYELFWCISTEDWDSHIPHPTKGLEHNCSM